MKIAHSKLQNLLFYSYINLHRDWIEKEDYCSSRIFQDRRPLHMSLKWQPNNYLLRWVFFKVKQEITVVHEVNLPFSVNGVLLGSLLFCFFDRKLRTRNKHIIMSKMEKQTHYLNGIFYLTKWLFLQ